MRKQFDKALYAKHDSTAKAKVLTLLKKAGYKDVREPERKTDVDLQVFVNEEVLFNVEVEVKNVWKNKDFPYDNVQFPERKRKYTKLKHPTLFVMFNKTLKNHLAVIGKDLASSPVEMVRNKYVRYGEHFFQVPLDRVTFDDLPLAVGKLEVV